MMNLCKFDWKKCLHIFFFENCIILFVEVYNHDKQQYISMIQKIHHWNLNTFFLNWKKVIHPKLKIHPQFFFKFFDNLVWHFHQKWYYLLFNSGVLNYYTTSFLGFSLYVSNTTERLEGTLCFKDKNFKASNIPSVFNIICPSIHVSILPAIRPIINLNYSPNTSTSHRLLWACLEYPSG